MELFDTFGMDSRVRRRQGTGWYDTEAAGSQSQYAHPSWMKVIRKGDLTPKLGDFFLSTFKKEKTFWNGARFTRVIPGFESLIELRAGTSHVF